jgi:DNA polymerase/3'-5' exonuclease PolX
MRAKAIEEGYHINEYAITKTENKDKPLKVTSEKDIFDYIDMEYKTPEERNM